MRIAIDARELSGRPTGVGRYLGELLHGWNELPGAAAHDFILCAPSPLQLPAVPQLRLGQVTAPGRGPWWEQRILPGLVAQCGADLLFAPGYSGPVFCPVPMVVTVHDVSFAAHPDWFAWREGLRRRVTTRWAARRARRVLTVSDFSKREIVRHLGIDATKIEVIYSGATPFGDRAPSEAAAPASSPAPLPASSPPTVLYVGSIFSRRHVPELIDACARLAARHPDLTLEIVGDNRSRPRIDVAALVRASSAAGHIRVRDYVSDTELAELYGRATAFAFLSEYEGFGLTPLDALAAGVPIVVLDTEVAREIYGPAAVYVPTPDPAQVASALERVLFDPVERGRLQAAAATVIERYSWHECAHRTLQALLAAAVG
jgi:glycosyltransferase involved in cell wall biosynthesis